MAEKEESVLQELPLGITGFSKMRKGNFVYVDKTDLIVQMLRSARYTFLARPRRFGKSLLVSTIAEIFSRGSAALTGLKGEKLWLEADTYPVVRLDFSKIAVFAKEGEFVENFGNYLKIRLAQAGVAYPANDQGDFYFGWGLALENSPQEVVVLIDEYDAPLTAHLHEPHLFEAARKSLARFFLETKSVSEHIRCLFITGVMKFRQASLFSYFNNLTDVSMELDSGALLGYTEEEILEYFTPYLERAASALNISTSDVLSKLKSNYDGYSFDNQAAAHVYAPWSVLSFLRKPSEGFRDYWFDSSTTSSLVENYLKLKGLLAPEEFDEDHVLALSKLGSADHITQINKLALLTFAGYLTIKQVKNGNAILGYPNLEVRSALAKLYASKFWSDDAARGTLSDNFFDALEERNPQLVLIALREIIHNLNYQAFRITSEALVQQAVQLFCMGAGRDVRIEVPSPNGRSDLELALDDTDVVFEFKCAQKTSDVSRLLKEAREQIIKRDYGVLRKGRALLRLATVFCLETRQFEALEEVPNAFSINGG